MLKTYNSSDASARTSAVEGLESRYEDIILLSGAARMAPDEILASRRAPGLPNARSTQLASALSARLFTSFGTVVYVDAGGQLRHGPIASSPVNALLMADPSWTGSRRRGSLMHEADGNRELIACAASRCVLSSTLSEHDRAMMQTQLDIVPLGRGLIALAAGGLFLCAEPDGRITLSRTVCSVWECFVASAAWYAEDSGGRLHERADARGMNIDSGSIERFEIPESLTAQIKSSGP